MDGGGIGGYSVIAVNKVMRKKIKIFSIGVALVRLHFHLFCMEGEATQAYELYGNSSEQLKGKHLEDCR